MKKIERLEYEIKILKKEYKLNNYGLRCYNSLQAIFVLLL